MHFVWGPKITVTLVVGFSMKKSIWLLNKSFVGDNGAVWTFHLIPLLYFSVCSEDEKGKKGTIWWTVTRIPKFDELTANIEK